jgi:hypothetical protein
MKILFHEVIDFVLQSCVCVCVIELKIFLYLGKISLMSFEGAFDAVFLWNSKGFSVLDSLVQPQSINMGRRYVTSCAPLDLHKFSIIGRRVFWSHVNKSLLSYMCSTRKV